MARIYLADKETLDSTHANTNAILAALEESGGEHKKAVRYGIKISKSDSGKKSRVTYLYDAVGMTPAAMNYTDGVFNYDDVINAQNQYLNPYILEERQLNVTQMDVFSRLMMDRIIFLGTQIDDYTANTLQAQLLYLDSCDPGKDISIYINSPGGSVYAGLAIYDTMQFIGCDVATICTGMAASMAAVLLVSGTEGKRSALKHSRVMIHQPMGGAQGQASDIEITAREIQKLKKELYTIIADHSHTPFDKVWADSDRDYWMTSQEALEYGMIDKVLERKKNDNK